MNRTSITHWLKQRRLPQYCALCTQHHQGQDAICDQCHEFFTPIPYACTQCARPLPKSEFLVCGQCIKKKPYFDQTIAPYLFTEPLRTLLHEFKYQQGLYLLSFLAQLIVRNLPQHAHQTECLIPVPLHPKRLQQRGFNQAAELTKYLGKTLNIPYQLQSCQKITHTVPQAELNASQRRMNLSNVFKASSLNYKHVTLIDDLLTTGSTANELAKTLKMQGIERVSVWCCARTIDVTDSASIIHN